MDPHSWSLHWDVLLAIGVLAGAYLWSQRRWPSDTIRRVAFDIFARFDRRRVPENSEFVALEELLAQFIQVAFTKRGGQG